MTEPELRPFPPAELPEAAALLHRAFGEEMLAPEMLAHEAALADLDRGLGAYLDGELVGTTWIQPLRMVTPGGADHPVAGVTGVAVSPVHRRRGILTALMRRQLADLRAGGTEAVAALWASEPSIYGRFGYGLAAPGASVRGERAHLRLVRPDRADLPLRLRTAPDWAELDPIHRAAARPGTPLRDPARWAARLADPPSIRDGATELVAVLAGPAGGAPEGYVLYRLRAVPGETGPAGVVRVLELVATTARAHAALWRHVSSLDLTATFEASGLAADDPLFHLVTDPRRLNFRLADGLFVRLVDLPRALAQRSYRAAAAATVEVVDEAGPWNAGRWRIEVTTGGSCCERTAAPADLTLSATELGAVYLGGPTLRTLALAGRVDEHTPGVLGALSDAFAGEVAPQCVEVF